MRRFPSVLASALEGFDGEAGWFRGPYPNRKAAARLRRHHAAFWRLRRLERLAFQLGVKPHLLELVLAYRSRRGFQNG